MNYDLIELIAIYWGINNEQKLIIIAFFNVLLIDLTLP